MDGRSGTRWVEMAAGLALVALGLLFLVGGFVDLRFAELWWPAFVVVPGLVMLAVAAGGHERAAPVAIPGAIVTTAGVLLAVQNVTGWWQTWAYVWPLVAPGAVGAGLWMFGSRVGKRQVRAVGRGLAAAGLAGTVVLGSFFELVLGLSGPVGPRIAGTLWPLALIAAGAWLILRRRGAH